jgi:hypothetical protein
LTPFEGASAFIGSIVHILNTIRTPNIAPGVRLTGGAILAIKNFAQS